MVMLPVCEAETLVGGCEQLFNIIQNDSQPGKL
jgi:hypothetical protein